MAVFISTIFLLPSPFAVVPLSGNNVINPENVSVNYKPIFPHFKSLSQEIASEVGLPNDVGYYDLHIVNQQTSSDWTYQWGISFDDPLYAYIARNRPALPIAATSSQGVRYDVPPSASYVIGPVPLSVGISTESVSAMCGWDPPVTMDEFFVKCPGSALSYATTTPDYVNVYATPNLISWGLRFLLIVAFWIVLMNSARSYFSRPD